MIDIYTFGGYRASVKLADILNDLNEKNIQRMTTRILSKYFTAIKDLENLKTCREYFLRIHLSNTKKAVFENSILPYNVKTHISNIITARYRETLKK